MDFNSTTLTVLSGHDQIQNPNASSYALNGKIMLCSVIVLFVVVVILVCFHSYARCLLHSRRHSHRHRRANQLFFLSSSTTNTNSDNVNTAPPQVQDQALDLSVLKRIPTFVYSSRTRDRLIDCAVCLSEFEDNEKGRVLPKCKHAFHVDCIDMWFRSHSNCPLCRTPIQLPHVEEVVSVIEPFGSLADRELRGVHYMGCSSSSSSLPPLELVNVVVEIPRVDFRGLDDMGLGSNNERNGFKLPGNRVLTLKRIWSI